MLLPSEIALLLDTAIENCPIREISQKFLTSVRTFFEGTINEISKVRTDIGQKDGVKDIPTAADLKKERKDPIVQRLLRNFTYLTKSQFFEFIGKVWEKYKRAQTQPGEAVGAIAA